MTDPTPALPEGFHTYVGSWRNRRQVVRCTLVFCALEVGYLTVWGTDTVLHQNIALGLIGLAFSVIGSYIAGAAWDDHSIRKLSQP